MRHWRATRCHEAWTSIVMTARATTRNAVPSVGRRPYAAPKDAAERIALELQLQEIRGQLRELPSAERLSVYLTTNDAMVRAAIETAPMTLSSATPTQG